MAAGAVGREELGPDLSVGSLLRGRRVLAELRFARAVGDEADDERDHEYQAPHEVTVEAAFEIRRFEGRRAGSLGGHRVNPSERRTGRGPA